MFSWERNSRSLTAKTLLIALAFVLLLAFASLRVAGATSLRPNSYLFSDDFTRDTQLNNSLWEISGPAGLNFSGENCPGCTNVTLAPSFSSAGMEIAQITGSYEVGTIQSRASFAPPFTVSAVVMGTVSNGHPFVFGVTSSDATTGVQVTGNLNPNDCSSEGDCGNSATCGTPANPSIPANQCYYGIYGRIGSSGGHWTKTPPLNPSPSVGVEYTLEISVDTAGVAQFNVSQGGQVLGSANGQVGQGPFYLILAQSEGAPVPGPGPNQAYWSSVFVVPSAPPPPAASSSPTSAWYWILVLIVAVAALIIVLVVVVRRRRGLTVKVLESETLSPLPGAGVWAEGPKYYSGSTAHDGRVTFGSIRLGDYAIKARATGYDASVPETVRVTRSIEHTVRLNRIASSAQPSAPATARLEGPGPTSPPPSSAGTVPSGPVLPTAVASSAPVPARSAEEPGEEEAGFGGPRIRQIVQTFRTKGAVSPETALSASELGLSRIFVRIMKRRRGQTRVFVEINGRYYLDETALREMK